MEVLRLIEKKRNKEVPIIDANVYLPKYVIVPDDGFCGFVLKGDLEVLLDDTPQVCHMADFIYVDVENSDELRAIRVVRILTVGCVTVSEEVKQPKSLLPSIISGILKT